MNEQLNKNEKKPNMCLVFGKNYRDEVPAERLVQMNEDVVVYCVIYTSNKRPKQQHA